MKIIYKLNSDIKTEDGFLDDGETCVETVEVTETSGEEDPLFSAKGMFVICN